jgi:hypothetical protein
MECAKDKESRNAYRILVEISLRKPPAGRLRLRHEDNIKMDTGRIAQSV